jgi:hypothetical protein
MTLLQSQLLGNHFVHDFVGTATNGQDTVIASTGAPPAFRA